MDSHAEFFEHSALEYPTSQIRLLRVQPGNEDSDICCKLQTFDFKQAPSYQAVSYIWGDPNDLRSILLNGKRHVVRYNCWNVLHQIRTYVIDEGEPPLVWVDALCINQKNLIEKGAQVQMMGEIFERATEVLVCPGPPNDDSSLLLHHLAIVEKIAAHLSPDRPSQEGSQIVLYKDAVPEWLNLLDEATLVQITRSIFEFESRAYWSRAWVAQELRLAKDRLLLCGRSPIRILIVTEFVSQFIWAKRPGGKGGDERHRIQPDLERNSEMAGLEPRALYQMPMDQAVSGSVFWTNSGLMDFSKELLEWVQSLKCSDPRDRIFALTRVFEWSTDTGPPSTEYTKTPFQVAVDAMMRVGICSESQAKGLDMIASMLNLVDISVHDLQEYFPNGLIAGALNAIMWRSERSLPPASLCSQCKSERPIYKLKVPIDDWLPIERDAQGHLTIVAVRGLHTRYNVTNDPAVDAFFAPANMWSEHSHGSKLGTHLSDASLNPTSYSELDSGSDQKTPRADAVSAAGRSTSEPFKHLDSNSLSRLTEASQEEETLRLPHTRDGISPLILVGQDHYNRPVRLLGMVNSSTRPGDLLVRISQDSDDRQQYSCRHLVLQHTGENVYEVSGHVFLPGNIDLTYRSNAWKDPPGHRFEWTTKTKLRMSIGIEDAIAYFLVTNDPPDLVQQINRSFCLRPVSSFAKLRPEIDPDPDIESGPFIDEILDTAEIERRYDFCLQCGRDLKDGRRNK